MVRNILLIHSETDTDPVVISWLLVTEKEQRGVRHYSMPFGLLHQKPAYSLRPLGEGTGQRGRWAHVQGAEVT